MTSRKSIDQRILEEEEARQIYGALIASPTLASVIAALNYWTPDDLYVHLTNNLGINFIILNPDKVMAVTDGNPWPLILKALEVEHDDTAHLLLQETVQQMLRDGSNRYAKLLRDTYVHRGMGLHTCWVSLARRGGVTTEQINRMMLSRLRRLASAGHISKHEIKGLFAGNCRELTADDGSKWFVLNDDANLFGLTDEGVLEALRLLMSSKAGELILSDWRAIAGRLATRPDLQEILWSETMTSLADVDGLDVASVAELRSLNLSQQLDALRSASAYSAPSKGIDTWQQGGAEAFRHLVELCLASADPMIGRSLFEELFGKFEAFDPIKLLRVVCQKEWWADNERRLGWVNRPDDNVDPDLPMLTWMRELLEPRARQAGYGLGEAMSHKVLLSGGVSRRVILIEGNRRVVDSIGTRFNLPLDRQRVAVKLDDLAPSSVEGHEEGILLPLSD